MQFQLSDANMDIMNSSTSDSERLSAVDPASPNPTSQAAPQNPILKEHQRQPEEGDKINNNNKTVEELANQEQHAEAEISIIGLVVEHEADATSDDICFDISMGIERFHQSEIILEDDIEGEEDDDACDQKDTDMGDSQQEFEIPLEGGEGDDDEYMCADDNNRGGAILPRSPPSCSVLLRQAQSRSSSDVTADDSDSQDTGMGDRRNLLARNKANSVAAIKCCTTRRAFSDHDAIILSNINEDEEEDESATNDDFERSLTRMSMDHQRRYTGSSSSNYSHSNRRQSNDSYASAYSTRGRRRSSMASTQSGATAASGGGRARRRTSRRMSTECHDSLILDELSALADATMRGEQATSNKSKCNPNDGSVDTIATAASSSASTFRRPSMLASAIENNDFYQRQPVANEDLYAYDGSCIITKLNRSIARDWDMSGGCPLKDQARRRKNRRSTMI